MILAVCPNYISNVCAAALKEFQGIICYFPLPSLFIYSIHLLHWMTTSLEATVVQGALQSKALISILKSIPALVIDDNNIP